MKFLEYYYPDLMDHLSTAKSPMQMQGAMTKTYYAARKKIDPNKIVSVAIMPCTAKKFEANRPEFNAAGEYHNLPDMRDIDFVLSTRELANFIKEENY